MTSSEKASYNRTLAWNFQGTEEKSFDSFVDCWDSILAGNSTVVNQDDVDKYAAVAEEKAFQTGVKFI